MWEIIRNKVELLKNYDLLYTVFDSSFHKYKFNEKLNISDLSTFESLNNITLPEQLHSFLLYFGNGGTGPDWGMYKLNEYKIYNPNNLHEDDIFDSNIEDFIVIFDRFYDYESCIITSGLYKNQIFSFKENSFFFKTHNNLFDFYLEWLENELYVFNYLVDKLKSNHSIEEIIINLFISKKIQPSILLKKLASLLNWKNYKDLINIDIINDYTNDTISNFKLSKNVKIEIQDMISQSQILKKLNNSF